MTTMMELTAEERAEVKRRMTECSKEEAAANVRAAIKIRDATFDGSMDYAQKAERYRERGMIVEAQAAEQACKEWADEERFDAQVMALAMDEYDRRFGQDD